MIEIIAMPILKPRMEQIIGSPITSQELVEARKYAERKLSMIMERESDADGARRETWYLEMFIEEALRSSRASMFARNITDIYQEIESMMTNRDKKEAARATNTKAAQKDHISIVS